MTKIHLSIIIPVYNVEAYISECLESIISQNMQQYEIIIVDDGSTDTSGTICDQYASKYEYIKVFHQTNKGVSAARNLGLLNSRGKYLTFIDPDDFVSRDTYCLNMNILLADESIDILQYPIARYWNQTIDKFNVTEQTIEDKEELLGIWWRGDVISFSMCNKIFKRELFRNITFSEGKLSEDTELVSILYKCVNKFFISNKGLYHYRVREDSQTYKYTFHTHLCLFQAHYKIYTELIKYNSLKGHKAIAFNRLLRRLISTQQANRNANLREYYTNLDIIIPSWKDLTNANFKTFIWLSIAKIFGCNFLIQIQLTYLRLKK